MTDIICTDSGDLPRSPSNGNPSQVLAQSLRAALSTSRGENPTDTSDGLPIQQWMQQKPIRTGIIAEQIRQEILELRQVDEVRTIEVDFDKSSRTLSVDGVIIASAIDDADVPFNAQISKEPNQANYLVLNMADV